MVVHSHIRNTGAASQVERGVVWRERGMKGSVFGSMLSIKLGVRSDYKCANLQKCRLYFFFVAMGAYQTQQIFCICTSLQIMNKEHV